MIARFAPTMRLVWLAVHLLTMVVVNLAFLGGMLTGTDLNGSPFQRLIVGATNNRLTSWLQQTYGQLSGTDVGFLFFSPQIGDDTVFETTFFQRGRAVTVGPAGLCRSQEGANRFHSLVDETVKGRETAELTSFSVAHRLLEMDPAVDSIQCRYYRQQLPRLQSGGRERTLLYSFSFSR